VRGRQPLNAIVTQAGGEKKEESQNLFFPLFESSVGYKYVVYPVLVVRVGTPPGTGKQAKISHWEMERRRADAQLLDSMKLPTDLYHLGFIHRA
jgi:hypothetical protein